MADFDKCQLSNLYENIFRAYCHDISFSQNRLSKFLNMLSLKLGLDSNASMQALKNAATNTNPYDQRKLTSSCFEL